MGSALLENPPYLHDFGIFSLLAFLFSSVVYGSGCSTVAAHLLLGIEVRLLPQVGLRCASKPLHRCSPSCRGEIFSETDLPVLAVVGIKTSPLRERSP